MDQWRRVKGVENTADIGARVMIIERLREFKWWNRPAGQQKEEDKWPIPWCQENKLETEQALSALATETQVKQPFNWNHYSCFNGIRNFIAYHMRFKTMQRGHLKSDKTHQAEQILFRFVQNERFPNASKSIANSKDIS